MPRYPPIATLDANACAHAVPPPAVRVTPAPRRRPGPRRQVALAAAVLVLAGCGAGCGQAGQAGRVPAASVAPADRALVDGVAALCDARSEAAAAVPAARGIFYDRAHEAMHALARRAETVDRAAAARLLEAKNTVETDFLYPRTWAAVGDDLAALDQAARGALGAVGLAAPAACGT